MEDSTDTGAGAILGAEVEETGESVPHASLPTTSTST